MNVTVSRVIPGSEWHLMPRERDDGPASRTAIGLVTLFKDVAIELESRSFQARDGMALMHRFGRLPLRKVG